MEQMNPSITDVLGIKVGHAQNDDALTGCTVIICEKGATGGIDQRGGAPGTRETDLMRPMHLVDKVHAILLAGGSAFGLDAATGVMKYLEERKIGFNTGIKPVRMPPLSHRNRVMQVQEAGLPLAKFLAWSTLPNLALELSAFELGIWLLVQLW